MNIWDGDVLTLQPSRAMKGSPGVGEALCQRFPGTKSSSAPANVGHMDTHPCASSMNTHPCSSSAAAGRGRALTKGVWSSSALICRDSTCQPALNCHTAGRQNPTPSPHSPGGPPPLPVPLPAFPPGAGCPRHAWQYFVKVHKRSLLRKMTVTCLFLLLLCFDSSGPAFPLVGSHPSQG